jgi:hypothetical protein
MTFFFFWGEREPLCAFHGNTCLYGVTIYNNNFIF